MNNLQKMKLRGREVFFKSLIDNEYFFLLSIKFQVIFTEIQGQNKVHVILTKRNRLFRVSKTRKGKIPYKMLF